MRHFLFALCLSSCLSLLLFANIVNAAEDYINDLPIPEPLSTNSKAEGSQQLPKNQKRESNLEKLLGPKDNFPFLPDNHRDSGTGKFNSF